MRRSGNIMKRYEIEFRKQIKPDIDQIKCFIVNKTSRENAERYVAELYDEIRSLSYLADSTCCGIKSPGCCPGLDECRL